MTDRVSLSLNGKEIESQSGRLLIDVAEEAGVFVPRFCYHPGLESVAACRMCMVQIEGSKRPVEPACVTYVSEGMVVNTQSTEALTAQESVLEMLLINHPLDCPICDRGGECPLQDQTLKFGPGTSRYADSKRHFPKPTPISDLVMLDRERCVLCWRCVRFAEEVAGDPFIDLMDRGSMTQVNVEEETKFDSYFSGNTIQICPVGALTATSYRFLSRPWDLTAQSSVCSYCSVGCPITLEQRGGEILRAQALPNDSVNSFWNCDKGRFGHKYPSHPDRLRTPLVRAAASGKVEFAESSWDASLSRIADVLKETLDSHGGDSIGLIGGSHATNEDLYAAGKFFREVGQSPNLDFRVVDDGFSYTLGRSRPPSSTAAIDDLDRARTILWVGPDPREELPVLYLRLRKAAAKARLLVIHPRRISLCEFGTWLRSEPGGLSELIEALATSEDPSMAGAREALAGGLTVVCVGPQMVGQDSYGALSQLSSYIDRLPDAKLLLCPPNSNSVGAIAFGVRPGGGQNGTQRRGLFTRQMLQEAASGKIRFLWLMGADLTSDFPDAALANRALTSGAFIVASELFPTDASRHAQVLLPAMSIAEKEGSVTNLEGRVQKINPAIPGVGSARADWHIFSELARRLGHDWGWQTSADVAKEISERVSGFESFSLDDLEDVQTSVSEHLDQPAVGGSFKAMSPVGGWKSQPGRDAWPLSWELRAVDATRRHGWVPRNGESDRAHSLNGPSEPEAPDTGLELESLDALKSRAIESGYPLMLLVSRNLYDGGAMATRAPELANVTPDPFVELHPLEAQSRGLSEGDEVSILAPSGTLRARLSVSDDTPRASAFVPMNLPGWGANLLMDATKPFDFVEVSR